MPIQMFDDGREEFNKTVTAFGQQVAGLITDRLHKKQFEDFNAGAGKDFQDHMKQATDILMDEDNPEGPSQGMQMLTSGLSAYMDEGARYADNPYIQNRVQQTFKMNMDMLDMNFKFKHEEHENNQATAKAKIDAAKAADDHNYSVAGTELRQAQTADRKAGGKDAAAKGNQLFSGAPNSLTQEDDDARSSELWARIDNTIDRPRNEAERNAIDQSIGEIRTQMAQSILADKVGRGERKPGNYDPVTKTTMDEPWDIYNKQHIDAIAGTIDPADVRNKFVMRKAQEEALQQGVTLDQLEKNFGVIVDPSKANAFRPTKTPVSSDNLGKILFGVGGWNSMRGTDSKNATPRDMGEAISRLPAELDKLGNSPIADVYKKNGTGTALQGIETSDIKTIADVKRLLNRNAANLAKAIIGDNADSASLPEGMQNNRAEAGKLITAMTDLYAEEIFEQMTGKKSAKTEEAAPGVVKRKGDPRLEHPVLDLFGKPVGEAWRIGQDTAKTVGDYFKD